MFWLARGLCEVMAYGTAGVLKKIGLLNELYSYSDVCSEPVKMLEVNFCTSEKCAGPNPVSKVRVIKHKNGVCLKCGYSVYTKLVSEQEYKLKWE